MLIKSWTVTVTERERCSAHLMLEPESELLSGQLLLERYDTNISDEFLYVERCLHDSQHGGIRKFKSGFLPKMKSTRDALEH